jgi:hypothetical protein
MPPLCPCRKGFIDGELTLSCGAGAISKSPVGKVVLTTKDRVLQKIKANTTKRAGDRCNVVVLTAWFTNRCLFRFVLPVSDCICEPEYDLATLVLDLIGNGNHFPNKIMRKQKVE